MSLDNLTVQEVWEEIDRVAKENKSIIETVNGSFVFEIKASEEVVYSLELTEGIATITEGKINDAQCTLAMSEKNFKKLLQGDLNATATFMMGRLKVKGDIGLALKLENMLKKLSF
ncbi:SCP2 sterol-binding domain-containing protein [Pseudogracilibacillus sp. ICA-222130]|uniref:SCP2 sterol-binding domain-containing protein n=1 Tax=Pseudogracilibacillus sp. ICA-222130 TaxID=3134655 RepID=UPI0030BA4C3A